MRRPGAAWGARARRGHREGGFTPGPPPGSRVLGKTGLFLSGWQPQSQGTGVEKPQVRVWSGDLP